MSTISPIGVCVCMNACVRPIYTQRTRATRTRNKFVNTSTRTAHTHAHTCTQAYACTSCCVRSCVRSCVSVHSTQRTPTVHTHGHRGMPVLGIAAWNNCVSVLKLLLQQPGIDVNLVADDDTTPLYYACEEGHQDAGVCVGVVVGVVVGVWLWCGCGCGWVCGCCVWVSCMCV